MEEEINYIKETMAIIGDARQAIQNASKIKEIGGSRYTEFVSEFLRAKTALENDGVKFPTIEFSGHTKMGVIRQIIATDPIFIETQKSLKDQRDVLEAELLYIESLKATGSLSNNLAESDLIVLDQSQKNAIHENLFELRKSLDAVEWRSDDHKLRVLEKFNSLQREIDREVSSYTRGLGKIVELGDAIGEFGKRVKPASDRIKDVMDSLRLFKKENAQISKQDDPLQIPDFRSDEE